MLGTHEVEDMTSGGVVLHRTAGGWHRMNVHDLDVYVIQNVTTYILLWEENYVPRIGHVMHARNTC